MVLAHMFRGDTFPAFESLPTLRTVGSPQQLMLFPFSKNELPQMPCSAGVEPV